MIQGQSNWQNIEGTMLDNKNVSCDKSKGCVVVRQLTKDSGQVFSVTAKDTDDYVLVFYEHDLKKQNKGLFVR